MELKEVSLNIGERFLVTDIYSGNSKCRCGKPLLLTELGLGTFGTALACSCGNEFWFAPEEEEEDILVYEGYDYIIDNQFIIVKQRVYSKQNSRSKRLSKHKLSEEKEFLYIDFESTLLVYFDSFGRSDKNGVKSFFHNFTKSDMETLAVKIEEYCCRQIDMPNYGSLLRRLINFYNSVDYHLLLKKVLQDYYIECFIKEGLGYLIETNFLSSIALLEKNVRINKNETSCSRILDIPQKAVAYIKESKISDQQIAKLQRFFRGNNYQDLKNLILSEDCIFTLHDLSDLIYLLGNGYSSYKLNNYGKMIMKEEGLSKDHILSYLVDSIRMSKTGDLDFKLYAGNLKIRHDELAVKYKLIKNTAVNNKLKSVKNHTAINQYGDKYIAMVPGTTTEFEEEAANQKNCVLSYAELMADDETLIVFIRDKNTQDKSYITLEVRDKKIIQAKRFANLSINEDDKKYLQGLARANGWI